MNTHLIKLLLATANKLVSYHDKLNPKIWSGDQIDQQIRSDLLSIANDFFSGLELPGTVRVKDIILTGSNANYNYSLHSDLDVHIIINFKDINAAKAIVTKLVNDEKTLFNDKHNIKIHKMPVEVYVQDATDPLYAGGVFSLLNDTWVTKPRQDQPRSYDDKQVMLKYNDIVNRIHIVQKLYNSGQWQATIDTADKLKDRIKNMRKCGLEHGGEFSNENLAFKKLRNDGHLDTLHEFATNAYDKLRSIG